MPLIPGHEAIGYVAAVGQDVNNGARPSLKRHEALAI